MMKSLRAIIILCLFINITICSSSFLFKRNLQEIDESISNQNVNSNALDEVSSRDLESDETQFQLLKFNSLLTHYKFNAKWDSGDSKDDSYTVLNECSSTNSQDSSALPICTLVSSSVCKDLTKVTKLSLDLSQSTDHTVDATNSVLKVNGVSSQILKKENDKVVSEKACHIDVSYSFINTPTQKPFVYALDSIQDLSIQVKVSGGDCEADNVTPLLQTEVKKYDAIKVYGYIAVMILLGLIQSIACGVLIIKIDRNNAFCKQAALGTLCMLISFDFSIYLQHSAYWTSVSNLMVGVVVLFFVVSVFFEPALLYFVFSTLRGRQNVSIRVLIFKLYFWLLLSVLCIVATQTSQSELIYYAYPLCLLPQIFDSMIHRQKYRWNYALLLGLGLPKLVYLSILAFDPFDIFTQKLNPSVMVLALTILAFELIILKIQTRWPGLGIIKKSTKDLFNYECQNDEIQTVAAVICSICTEKVGLDPIIGQQPTQEDTESGKEAAKAQPIMKTPCLHYYHESCLKEWFKKKYECPNCRQTLPPLDNEDDE